MESLIGSVGVMVKLVDNDCIRVKDRVGNDWECDTEGDLDREGDDEDDGDNDGDCVGLVVRELLFVDVTETVGSSEKDDVSVFTGGIVILVTVMELDAERLVEELNDSDIDGLLDELMDGVIDELGLPLCVGDVLVDPDGDSLVDGVSEMVGLLE